MKKIILSIFCLFSINVYAETFYTDYTLVEENSTKYNKEYEVDELKKIERKVGYNNYTEIRSIEDYYELGLAPSYLNYVDLSDYINKDIYAKEPFDNNDEQYNTLRIKKYSTANSIALRSFASSGILKNISITYNASPINYIITESNYDFKSPLLSTHMIVLNLGKKYDLDKLNIKLTFEDNTLNALHFMLNVYSSSYYLGCPYVYYDNEVFRSNTKEVYNINFIDNLSFNNLLTNISWIRKNDYDITNSVNYYKKNTNLYKYYTLDKRYLNVYTTEPLNGYKLDYNKKKKLYDYYERDYISVEDEITSLEELNNIVKSSSIPLDKLIIESKITKDYILAIIKTNNNAFFKKYPLIINEEEIEPSIDRENHLEETNDLSNNLNSIQGESIINIEENVKKPEIINDFFDTNDEIIIEKDFDANNYINIYKPKNTSKNTTPKDDTIALLIPEESKELKNDNYQKKLNYILILIILLIICVKFLTQYLNKKKSFVEPV